MKIIKLMMIASFLLGTASFGQNTSYYKYTLTESDLPGYQLNRVSETFLNTGFQYSTRAMKQTWQQKGENKTNNILIKTAVFDNELQAISGMTNLKGSYSVPFEFGTLTSCTIGDKSWYYLDTDGTSILFLRGNIGIIIDQIPASPEEYVFLETIAARILEKVESNLSENILSMEEQVRAIQIPLAKYNEIVSSTINLPIMRDFSSSTVWESKWKVNETKLVMGRRVEWKNTAGAVVGIDIAEFDSETAAKQAMEIRLNEVKAHLNSPLSSFQIDAPSSIDSLVSQWQSNSFADRIISGISSKGKVVIHIYHYNSHGNDTALFSAITKEVANKISF